MRRQAMAWACLLVLGLGLVVPAMAQTTPAKPVVVPPVADLVYQGATIKMQVDVNGAAAVELVGGLLDAATAAVEGQAKAMPGPEAQLQGPAAKMRMVAPMVGPARDLVKSLDRVTVLQMVTAGPVAGEQFIAHYQGLMQGRGWTPLITVRGQGMPAVATLVAPQGKGLFAAVSPGGNQVIVAVLTMTRPIGELVGQLAEAGQSAMPQLMAMMNHPRPTPAAEPEPEKPAEETPEPGK
jgi:hypothetical protein